ncbi:MAG: DUF455 family protein [Myxococcota bacterium]
MTSAPPPHAAGPTGAFARSLLERGDLESKLTPPPAEVLEEIRLPCRAPPVQVDLPAREPGLDLGDGAEALPRPGSLASAGARASCLARFAHHELMAVELFAWALLRWPSAPSELRAEWLRILADEQRHCRLYLERLRAHGRQLTDYAPHSAYFWRQARAVGDSPHGVRAFLAAMGLTLEQANLDFTLVYRDGFREAGDEASAAVCQRVHDDEIGHVRSAARWLQRLDAREAPEPRDLVGAYERAVPYPLSAARAKGRRFDTGARRRAGLGGEFIEHVRSARSSQETGVRPGARGPERS